MDPRGDGSLPRAHDPRGDGSKEEPAGNKKITS